MGSTCILSCGIGTTLEFILGNYCDYETTPKLAILLIILFAFAFYFFPESPNVLWKQNRAWVSKIFRKKKHKKNPKSIVL